MGRITQLQKVVSGTPYTITRTYNYNNQRTAETYPSGRVVNTSFDAIGRATSISSGSTTYVSALSYNPAQQITGFTYGNGVAAGFTFTPQRMQLQSLSYTNGAQTVFSLTYGYTQNGGNNGQITSITDNVQSVRTVNFSYDALGRMTSGTTTGGSTQYPQWGLQWTYDRFGSRIAQSQIPSGGGGPINSVTPSTSANLISQPVPPYAYEARGNMTGDGLNALAYDAENRLLTNTDGLVTTYGYDAKNLRVTKTSGGSTTVYIFSGGQVIAEYTAGSLSNEYIYLGDQLIATHAGTTLTYHHRDHLSVRINTEGTSGSPNFGQVVGEQGHYPFGEQWYATGRTTKWMFTSYERDPESGNDYAVYRFHANRLGRFLSPDPVNGSSANPQSLNRYAYTVNDPVNRTDPNGLCTIEVICSLWPPSCGVYEFCGPPIPQPELPFGRELDGGGSGGRPWFGIEFIDCDCTLAAVFPAPIWSLTTCTYGCRCTNLPPNVTQLYANTVGNLAKECPLPPGFTSCPRKVQTQTVVIIIFGFALPAPARVKSCGP